MRVNGASFGFCTFVNSTFDLPLPYARPLALACSLGHVGCVEAGSRLCRWTKGRRANRTLGRRKGRGHCLSGQALCLWGRRQLATQGSAIANIASTVSENGAPRSQPTSRTALDTAVLYRLLLPLPICNLSSRASGGARSGIGHELGSIRPAGGMLVRKNDQESTYGSMLSSFKVVR